MKPEIFPISRGWLAALCLGVMSVPGSLAAAEKAPAALTTEKAAYEEIVALKPRKGDAELIRLAPAFLEKYPDSAHFEKIAGLHGEALMRRKDWKAALACYTGLAGRFPKSPDIDRFKFQTAICRHEMGDFATAELQLEDFLKTYPASGLQEEATYRLAIAYFLQNKYKETLVGCRNYLKNYPTGIYAGDIIYRLAFIDANDKAVDQSENIIDNLEAFIAKNPADAAVDNLRCLLADTWLKRELKNPAGTPAAATEMRANEDKALDHYRQAALSPAIDSAKAGYASKAAEALFTKHGDPKALGAFQADYRKQQEARVQKAKEEEGQ